MRIGQTFYNQLHLTSSMDLKTVLLITTTLAFFIQFCYSQLPVVSMLTFNAALSEHFPSYHLRKSQLHLELQKLGADFMCLQDVWYVNDITDLALKLPDYNVHIPEPPRGKFLKHPCQVRDMIDTIFECTEALTVSTDFFLMCMVKSRLMEANQQCISCVMIAKLNLLVRCTEWGSSVGPINVAGVVLLTKSKFDLTGKIRTMYHEENNKQLFERASLVVQNVPDIGTVICGHASPDINPHYLQEPYLFDMYGSFAKQNYDEAKLIIERFSQDDRVVIMGDMNMGVNKTSTGTKALFPETYKLFTGSGYTSPYMEFDGRCSLCITNAADKTEKGSAIDHVLVRNLLPITARRVLDQPIPGTNIRLSDHNGVLVTVLLESRVSSVGQLISALFLQQ